MSIPLLLVCDGGESKQATLEGLVKNEPGLKYIATASMQEGTRAVERAVKVGAKLIWIDLDEEPVEGLNLLAETRKLHPMLNVIVSRTQLDPDMVRAALQLGALDVLDPARAAQQLNVVVENLKDSGMAQSTVSQAGLQAQTLAPTALGNTSPSPILTTGGGNKWVDLDSIPTPGTKSSPPPNQDVTGEIQIAGSGIQDLVASQSAQSSVQPGRPTTELPASGSKWGDLDSIGAPANTAPAALNAPAPAQGVAIPAPAPSPTPAASPTPSPTPAPTGTPAASSPASGPSSGPAPVPASISEGGGPNNFNGLKWGDLDAIPTPKAALEAVGPRPTGEVARPLSDLDSIPSPSAPSDRPATPMPKPEPHVNTNKALRPSPEKAELYSMGSPVMMAVVIIVIIFGAIAFMFFKQHSQPTIQPTDQSTIQPTNRSTSQPTSRSTK